MIQLCSMGRALSEERRGAFRPTKYVRINAPARTLGYNSGLNLKQPNTRIINAFYRNCLAMSRLQMPDLQALDCKPAI